MQYDPDKHQRRSIRLKEYDYSQPGAYFVTICTRDRDLLFDNPDINSAATDCWFAMPGHFPNITIDEFVVMPNHIHGILIMSDVRVQNFEPLRNEYQHIIPRSLGSVIRTYKSAVTTWCRNNNHDHFAWQRNYYEHIIRNETDLNNIRQYIMDNPTNWEADENNPKLLHEALRK